MTNDLTKDEISSESNIPNVSDEELQFRQQIIDYVALIEHYPDSKQLNNISAERVLCCAQQGCFDGWYPAENRERRAEELQQKLVDKMLSSRGCRIENLVYNLNAPNSLYDLPDDGWLHSELRETMSNSDDRADWNPNKRIERYTGLRAVEFDYNRAKIQIFADKYDPEKSDRPCLFTSLDVAELLCMGELQTGPSLSMGPVDPKMGDLPFQRVTFSPSYMYSSRLMRCMFICDYILKWMVTGSEIQFKPDSKTGKWFETRSIKDGLLKHLPPQLHALVAEFRDVWTKVGCHRVWFESERVPIFEDVNEDSNKETHYFGDMRMLFKQQKQNVDDSGQMQSMWNSRPDERKAFVVVLDCSANIVSYECTFWDSISSDKPVAKFNVLDNDDDELLPLLRRLTQFETTKHGLVSTKKFVAKCNTEDDREDKTNERIETVYKVLRVACQRVGLEHGYSPLYCFVNMMTDSYDLLAQHIPEFGRLRELSKLVALVKLMASRRRELVAEADKAAAAQRWPKRFFTSSSERKRLVAFNKALAEMHFGLRMDDNFSTIEQEEKCGTCYWVPAFQFDPNVLQNGDGTTMQRPDWIYGGTSMEREAKRVKLANQIRENRFQGIRAENYVLEQLMQEEGTYICPQVRLGSRADGTARVADFIVVRPVVTVDANGETTTSLPLGSIEIIEVKSGNAHRDSTQLAVDQWHQVNNLIATVEKNLRDPSLFKDYSTKQPQSIKHKVDSRRYLLLPIKGHGLKRIDPPTPGSYSRLPVGI
ncbi:unnamed protein product, partial [Mesorhabditis belari]|uniref:Uncharacterized protein n=1 Tax=Mesorhabditis belari TaxID=2138241 RepID=A0AAF3FGB0_9BILA